MVITAICVQVLAGSRTSSELQGASGTGSALLWLPSAPFAPHPRRRGQVPQRAGQPPLPQDSSAASVAEHHRPACQAHPSRGLSHEGRKPRAGAGAESIADGLRPSQCPNKSIRPTFFTRPLSGMRFPRQRRDAGASGGLWVRRSEGAGGDGVCASEMPSMSWGRGRKCFRRAWPRHGSGMGAQVWMVFLVGGDSDNPVTSRAAHPCSRCTAASSLL